MRHALPAVVAAAFGLLGASSCQALADDDIKLGPIKGFANEAQAQARCRPDAVVWADRKTGFYYPRFAPEYGKTPTGAFACFKQAQAADYWGFGPLASMPDKGRTFPYSPGPFCVWVVDKNGHGFCGSPGM